MKLSILGDIMLSRYVGLKYKKKQYEVVSSRLKSKLKESDYIIANLESPILNRNLDEDHLVFNADQKIFQEVSFIDFFSLANNHINDCGAEGIKNTIDYLDSKQVDHNGVYLNDYNPFATEIRGLKLAIFTCTDMMNVPIDHHYKVPHFEDKFLLHLLRDFKDKGYFIIMFAHIGQLFSRYPNPSIRNSVRNFCDYGADVVVTVHPHVLGGIEYYNNKPIVYSLGDFIMDGSSSRRRRAGLINIDIDSQDNSIINIEMTPTFINENLETDFAKGRQLKKSIKSWNQVSKILGKWDLSTYNQKYNTLYKFEILQHNISTIMFLLRNKGLVGFFKIIFQRFREVKMMFKWILIDRKNLTRDDDAIPEDRKKIFIKE